MMIFADFDRFFTTSTNRIRPRYPRMQTYSTHGAAFLLNLRACQNISGSVASLAAALCEPPARRCEYDSGREPSVSEASLTVCLKPT